MIHIDGSLGEGGGQIVRSALAISMVTARPFRIDNIRANRRKPGLLRQHLTAAKAAAQVCNAQLIGAELGSSSFEFVPGEVQGGEYHFAIGSAGSTTLVLQSILPAIMIADKPSSIVIEGGTHNMYAPTTDFLCNAFIPVLENMGPKVRVELERYGFYPSGGGRIRVNIEPADKMDPLSLTHRGDTVSLNAQASVAALSGDIAKRELRVISKKLDLDDDSLQIRQLDDSFGPGNVVTLIVKSEQLSEVFAGIGELGRSAEQVAKSIVVQVHHYIHSDVPVWKHLADQLMIPCAIAAHRGGGRSEYLTGQLTLHSKTNIQVIRSFLDIPIDVSDVNDRSVRVQIG